MDNLPLEIPAAPREMVYSMSLSPVQSLYVVATKLSFHVRKVGGREFSLQNSPRVSFECRSQLHCAKPDESKFLLKGSTPHGTITQERVVLCVRRGVCLARLRPRFGARSTLERRDQPEERRRGRGREAEICMNEDSEG